MKRQIITLILTALLGSSSFAAFEGPGSSIPATTVKAAKQLHDDTSVILVGYLIKQTGEDHYLFKDSTGTITVEIDDTHFHGRKITPQTKIKLYGEVDKEYHGTKIEIDHFEVIQ
jgi:uncharacterized protein (TIGR00156 family)